METFEILYTDLNSEAQKNYLRFVRATDESEINIDIPLCMMDIEDDDDEVA